MSIKSLLPIAGLVALIGCGATTGPNCLVNEPQIGVDSLGAEVPFDAKVKTAECDDSENDF